MAISSDEYNNKTRDLNTDVFIAGGGPIGATYAKLLVEAGYDVVMAELGAADSFREFTRDDGRTDYIPGFHKKNTVEYQKASLDIDRFVHVIQGALSLVSVPVQELTIDTLNPSSWGAQGAQKPTHWTCATPRFNKDIELPVLVDNKAENSKEWDRLYYIAEKLIGTTTTAFDESIRHTLILRTLQDAFSQQNRTFESLPLACHRMPNADYVNWHATDTILEHIYMDPEKRKRFTLLTNHRCTSVEVVDKNASNKTIGAASLKNFLANRDGQFPYSFVQAKIFIIAAGAVATPQILFKSGFVDYTNSNKSLIKNLGKYITEQPMTFCQVILKSELMDLIPRNPFKLDWWQEMVRNHKERHPEDPLRFPFRDPEPQVTSKVSQRHPWHAQIHRDAFSYGNVAATIDSRTIVDLRFFGFAEPRVDNTITFESGYEDDFGMPQPTFHFQLSDDDRKRAHRMMLDMCEVADKLGGFLPGSEPQFMAPGLALHLGGTTRAGLDPETHVADTNCKVYGFSNLYVGGNGVIPTGFASNPTLTSMCYAIRSAEAIVAQLGGQKKVVRQ
ncbi:hypothetical protein EW145_g5921 [Phellinidium pouzarii]|uniref:Pyranose 2-oxidase n=1 Tax=Phellinidium pouzarii TaxID=167371 RepID=A0A4V3XBZ8_9AGAM|nr:hypothetical protein EW145_g5921 [Phellinidium pouzarii]